MKFNKNFFSAVVLYLFYTAINLTNGYLPDFFAHINKGSMLYANMWEHFLQGNFLIDPEHTRMEYFVLGDDKFTVYYGFFPAFIRGFFDVFLVNIYKYNFNNLSILAALFISIFFLYRTFVKLELFSGKAQVYSVMFFIALFLASPVVYITGWGWMYNEPIIWGFAWAVSYISLFFLWVFKPEERNLKTGILMGLCVSMAILSRIIDAVIPVLSFGFLVIKAVYDFYSRKDKTCLKAISGGIVLCLFFGGFTLKINADRWGNPFVFQQFDKNIQVIDNPERLAGFHKEGMWNINRLPASFKYYFIPSQQNFRAEFPFIDVDRELTIIKEHPYYDLIMSSRIPLTLSALFLLVFAILGIYRFRKLNKKEKIYLIPLILAGLLQYFALLIYGGITLRYSIGFIFLIILLAMIFLIVESRIPQLIEKPKFLYLSLIVFMVSLYINFFTMLAYKHYIWDISPNTREFIGKIINYEPKKEHIRLIKHNTDCIKFSP